MIHTEMSITVSVLRRESISTTFEPFCLAQRSDQGNLGQVRAHRDVVACYKTVCFRHEQVRLKRRLKCGILRCAYFGEAICGIRLSRNPKNVGDIAVFECFPDHVQINEQSAASCSAERDCKVIQAAGIGAQG